jgi:hypothetical protein
LKKREEQIETDVKAEDKADLYTNADAESSS